LSAYEKLPGRRSPGQQTESVSSKNGAGRSALRILFFKGYEDLALEVREDGALSRKRSAQVSGFGWFIPKRSEVNERLANLEKPAWTPTFGRTSINLAEKSAH